MTIWKPKSDKYKEDTFTTMWREMPFNPFYWKSPREKADIRRRDELIDWAYMQGMPNPEAYVEELLSKTTGEVTMRAVEGEGQRLPSGQWRPPEGMGYLPTESPTERFIGEWVAPGAVFAALPTATALRAALPAKGILPKVARVALKPVEMMETTPAKILSKGKVKYEQLLEGHRVARTNKLLRVEYEKLAKEITGKTSMKNMTTEEAEKFIGAMGKREIELPYMDMSNATARKPAMELAKELSEYMGAPKPKPTIITKETAEKGFGSTVANKYRDFIARADRVDRILWKADNYEFGKIYQTFYNSTDDATNRVLWGEYKAIDGFVAQVKQLGIPLKTLFSAKTEILPGVRLTTGERVGIYLHSKNPDNMRHVVFGNFGRLKEGEANTLIKQIIDTLTPEEKAIGDSMFNIAQKNTPLVAEAYKMGTGKTMKTVENYWRITLKGEADVVVDPMVGRMELAYAKRWPSSKIKKSFTKPRTGKATQEIELDAFDTFFKSVHEVEHYKNFTPLMRDLQRIYANPGFKNSFKSNIGEANYRVLGNWLEDVAMTNPMAVRSYSEGLLRTLRVNATTGVLGFNITTALKQFPSYLIGAAHIGNVPALRGFVKTINRAAYKETQELMSRLAPQMRARVMERELLEAQLLKGVTRKITGGKSLREIFMVLTTTMDRFAVNSIWRGSFDDMLKKGMTEQAAARAATLAIKRTQPFFSIKEVPEFWRSGEGMRMLTMFQNQLNNYWNYFRYDVVGARGAGKISNAEVMKKVIEGFVAPALMIGWVTRSRPAQDAKEIMEDTASMALAAIPLFGQFLSSGLHGFRDSQGVITTEALGEFQEAAYYMAQEQWDRALLVIPEAAGLLAGIPVKQPARTLRGLLDIASGKSEDLFRLIWSGYSRDLAQKELEKTWAPTKKGEGRWAPKGK